MSLYEGRLSAAWKVLRVRGASQSTWEETADLPERDKVGEVEGEDPENPDNIENPENMEYPEK